MYGGSHDRRWRACRPDLRRRGANRSLMVIVMAEVGLYTVVVVALTCAGCERRRSLLDSHLIRLVLLFVSMI